jgi:hypothetical protein
MYMKIKSLAITKNPVWFDVPGGMLDKFEFSAKTRFWPEKGNSAALFLFEFADPVDTETLRQHRITLSGVGYYAYLEVDALSGDLQQFISIPNGKIKRVGIRLWSSNTPVVLEDITIRAYGGSLHSQFIFSDRICGKGQRFDHIAPQSDVLALNISSDTHACTPHCHAIGQYWFKTMDDVQRRYPNDDAGRTNCLLDIGDGIQVPISILHAKPAMLRIPLTLDGYLEKIGDKSRNMIRKAQRLGYSYKPVDPEQYLDDIWAIRTSDPVRQGKPIPDYFKVRPTHLFDEHFKGGCERHGEHFYGLFLDEKLIAYSTIYFYGQLAQVNHILGHKDHLKEGVMNLLVSELVGNIITHRPWVRAINYLYPDVVRADGGVGMFKKSIGFYPETVLVTQSGHDLVAYFAPRATEDAVAEPAKKSAKAGTSRLLRESAESNHFIHSDKMRDRSRALDFALSHLRELLPSLHTLSHHVSRASLQVDVDIPYAVVVEQMSFGGYQNFLSAGLKGYRESLPRNSFLIFDFKRTPNLSYVRKSAGLRLPQFLQSSGRKVNEDLIAYLSKRFKAATLSLDHIKNGFKGSDYVVAGLLDYRHSGAYDQFDSLLILKKIR